jgi:hypothetical protein
MSCGTVWLLLMALFGSWVVSRICYRSGRVESVCVTSLGFFSLSIYMTDLFCLIWSLIRCFSGSPAASLFPAPGPLRPRGATALLRPDPVPAVPLKIDAKGGVTKSVWER